MDEVQLHAAPFAAGRGGQTLLRRRQRARRVAVRELRLRQQPQEDERRMPALQKLRDLGLQLRSSVLAARSRVRGKVRRGVDFQVAVARGSREIDRRLTELCLRMALVPLGDDGRLLERHRERRLPAPVDRERRKLADREHDRPRGFFAPILLVQDQGALAMQLGEEQRLVDPRQQFFRAILEPARGRVVAVPLRDVGQIVERDGLVGDRAAAHLAGARDRGVVLLDLAPLAARAVHVRRQLQRRRPEQRIDLHAGHARELFHLAHACAHHRPIAQRAIQRVQPRMLGQLRDRQLARERDQVRHVLRFRLRVGEFLWRARSQQRQVGLAA